MKTPKKILLNIIGVSFIAALAIFSVAVPKASASFSDAELAAAQNVITACQTYITQGGLPSNFGLGNSGQNIKCWQTILNASFPEETVVTLPGSETNYFGSATYAATQKFQTITGIFSTGYVGSQTRELVSNDYLKPIQVAGGIGDLETIIKGAEAIKNARDKHVQKRSVNDCTDSDEAEGANDVNVGGNVSAAFFNEEGAMIPNVTRKNVGGVPVGIGWLGGNTQTRNVYFEYKPPMTKSDTCVSGNDKKVNEWTCSGQSDIFIVKNSTDKDALQNKANERNGIEQQLSSTTDPATRAQLQDQLKKAEDELTNSAYKTDPSSKRRIAVLVQKDCPTGRICPAGGNACVPVTSPSPSPQGPIVSATPFPSPSATPFPTATPRPTATPTPRPTSTPIPTIRPTPTPTPYVWYTPYPTSTPTPYPTFSPTPTSTPTTCWCQCACTSPGAIPAPSPSALLQRIALQLANIGDAIADLMGKIKGTVGK